MRGVETRIQEIRHKIFTEVARMAYHTEWPVKERMEELPYKIIPGETGNFRNDVFLERAIVGERLRLAMGLPNRSAAELQKPNPWECGFGFLSLFLKIKIHRWKNVRNYVTNTAKNIKNNVTTGIYLEKIAN